MSRPKPTSVPERSLVTALRSGDPSAWGKVYDLYAHDLYYRILMPRLADPVAAEDALSDTFKTAIEKFDQFRTADQNGLFPWLSRIAHNKAMDMHRARAVTHRKLADLSRLLSPLSVEVTGAEDLLQLQIESRVLERRLEHCLATLNPRYREVIRMRFLEEASRERCAAHFAVQVKTLDVLLLRALRALKKAWSEAPDEQV